MKNLRYVAGLLVAQAAGIMVARLADSFVLGVIVGTVFAVAVLYLTWESSSHGPGAGNLRGQGGNEEARYAGGYAGSAGHGGTGGGSG